jgi:YVTN family beta-propeller protein
MGFSFDHKTLAVVSIGSNSVTFIDTATNAIKHITYVGRSPHEAFFTPDDSEVWVTMRGENYVQVIDGRTYENKDRIYVGDGPGMTIFSPDGKYGYVCSSSIPETKVVDVHSREIVGTVQQASPFCPNIAATPDGRQVWFTLKDTGKTQVFNARPPFNVLATLETGPITNHVNFVRNMKGQFAYITIGVEDLVKVYTTTNTQQLIATIPTGDLPHGLTATQSCRDSDQFRQAYDATIFQEHEQRRRQQKAEKLCVQARELWLPTCFHRSCSLRELGISRLH